MKRMTFLAIVACLATFASAQDIQSTSGYHRSSLFVLPVVHMQDSFAAEIYAAAQNMPFPDRYNDMNEGGEVQVVKLEDHSDYKTLKDTTRHRAYDGALASTEVAKHIVEHWFNYDPEKGFNTDRLVAEGMYDASELRKELALGTMAGVVNLADAGDELIGKSFVLVNEMSYINHAERAAYVSAVSEAIAEVGKGVKEVGEDLANTKTGLGLLDAVTGLVGSAMALGGMTAELAGDLTKATNDLLDIRGFAVCEATYLYQLDWNEDVQNVFYSKYYTETGDKAKLKAFLEDKETFRLKYVGMMPTVTNNATAFNVSEYSKKSQSEQILITCSRTLDDAINTLQVCFPEFRVYTPITDIVTDAKGKVLGVRADIGIKEGVTLKKKYVIREMVFKNGKTQYQDVIANVKADKPIWDNRFGLDPEEGAPEGDEEAKQVKGTVFKAKKNTLYKGMLLIEK